MNQPKDETRLLTICRKCEYRRNAHNDEYYRGDSRRVSRCAYLNLTGECRGCEPTEGECEKFTPRKGNKTFTSKKELVV